MRFSTVENIHHWLRDTTLGQAILKSESTVRDKVIVEIEPDGFMRLYSQNHTEFKIVNVPDAKIDYDTWIDEQLPEAWRAIRDAPHMRTYGRVEHIDEKRLDSFTWLRQF